MPDQGPPINIRGDFPSKWSRQDTNDKLRTMLALRFFSMI